MTSMPDWTIEGNRAGGGMVKHLAVPRFTAKWQTGEADFSAIDGFFWQEEGSENGEDGLTLHSFEWIGPPPDQAAFKALMQQAALAIDDWVSSRF
jgi:hypothetical protein